MSSVGQLVIVSAREVIGLLLVLLLLLQVSPTYSWGGQVPIILGWGFSCLGLLLFMAMMIFPCRSEIPPREHSFKKHCIIWGLWYTGRDVLASNLIGQYPDKVRRILLLNPESDGFNKNMEETSGHPQSSKRNIIRLTQIAQGYGISVRWYDTNQNKSLTFYDPLSDKRAWLVWRQGQLYTPADKRPLHKFTKKDNRAEFDDNLALFNDIWDKQSHEPNIHIGDIDDEEKTENQTV